MGDNSDDPARSDDGSVVDPEELDIEDDDHVRALGDNRYVVSPGDPIADNDDRLAGSDDPSPPAVEPDRGSKRGEESDSEESSSEGSGDARGARGRTGGFKGDSVDVHHARACLTERMIDSKGAYGFDVTAQFGDEVVQQHLQANDIITVFDALLLWYAEHLDDETPAEEAIGLLLAESDIPIEYPADALIDLVRAHGLGGNDTIAELVDAACEETVQFPPQ